MTSHALARTRGYLRRELAGLINRKRVPALCFALAVPSEDAGAIIDDDRAS